jgi:hypothetical protein
MVVGTRPCGGKRPRSARGAAALLACGPTKHSSISLKRSREIESVFKRGAFALVDASDALGKSKRDAGIGFLAGPWQEPNWRVIPVTCCDHKPIVISRLAASYLHDSRAFTDSNQPNSLPTVRIPSTL